MAQNRGLPQGFLSTDTTGWASRPLEIALESDQVALEVTCVIQRGKGQPIRVTPTLVRPLLLTRGVTHQILPSLTW